MAPAARKGRYEVVVGAVGTLVAEGNAVYHRLGDFVDLAEDEAERLLGLGAVKDTKAADYVAPEDRQVAPAAPAPEGGEVFTAQAEGAPESVRSDLGV